MEGMHHSESRSAEHVKDYDRLVCSPEFPKGCADPSVGAPPCLTPCANVPDVKARSQADPGARAADDLPPAPIATHNASEDALDGFHETACSAEFPKGCVNPGEM